MEAPIIATEERNTCPACERPGLLLFSDLKDRIFEAPGLWSLKKCSDSDCGTLWLDPTPKESDIYLLYKSYSTHSNAVATASPRNKNLEKLRNTLLFQKYGYGHKPSLTDKLIKLIMYIHPAWKDIIEAGVFYIPLKKNGALLDVGCGGGSTMVNMQNKGWKVFGTDVDPRAVENARSKGLEVYYGDLYSQKFEDNRFDAVLLSHVIEHVTFPNKIISECYRILKPGGTISIITPNAASRGFKRFGRDWRGLETPQHLQIFTPNSLVALARQAGFSDVKSFSSPHGDLPIINQSIELSKHEKMNIYIPVKMTLLKKFTKHLSFFLYGWLNFFTPNKSEIAVLICKK